MNKRGVLMMIQWFVLACCLHTIAILCAGLPWPQISTVFWKLGNGTLAAYCGYWIAIHVLSHAGSDMAKAVIIAATMIAVSMGM